MIFVYICMCEQCAHELHIAPFILHCTPVNMPLSCTRLVFIYTLGWTVPKWTLHFGEYWMTSSPLPLVQGTFATLKLWNFAILEFGNFEMLTLWIFETLEFRSLWNFWLSCKSNPSILFCKSNTSIRSIILKKIQVLEFQWFKESKSCTAPKIQDFLQDSLKEFLIFDFLKLEILKCWEFQELESHISRGEVTQEVGGNPL